jgi:hypothetical protein
VDTLLRQLAALLRSLAGDVTPQEPLVLLVRAVTDRAMPMTADGFATALRVPPSARRRWNPRHDFSLACALRAYELLSARMDGPTRQPTADHLSAALAAIEHRAHAAPESPGERLWSHWLLLLGRQVLARNVEESLLTHLWQAGTSAQDEEGRLHPLDPEASLDAWVFDELAALHAAASAAASRGQPLMLALIHRTARYHLANTQPDNTMNVPWALPAFALFPDTRSFAEQQLHDLGTHWGSPGAGSTEARALVAALLADAVVTLRAVKLIGRLT